MMSKSVKKSILRGFALATLASVMIAIQADSSQAQWATNGTNINNTNPGGVGIGTADPTQAGQVGSKFTVVTTDDNATAIATSNGTLPRFALNNHSNGSWTMHDYVGNVWHTGITQYSGNVGVGTRTPVSPLEIQAPDAPITLSQAGVAAKSTVQSAVGSDLHMSANAKWLSSTWNRYDTATPSWNIFLAPSPGADYAGIRRASPGAGTIVWTDFFRVTNTGNIGVGTTSPNVKLAINGTGANVYSTDAWIENNMHIQGNETISQGGGRGRMRLGTAWGYVGLYAEKSSAGAANDLVLGAGSGTVRVGPGGTNITQSFVVPNGKVGIGTDAPATALHVMGDITVSGNINAKYQDLAEWVPSREKLEAGTVVILDIGRNNHVAASSTPYDTRVAGVISAQPGISLGEAGEGKALVATTGRVKVKVDATRAPIRVGDLLVTGETAGVAMRSQPLDLGGVPIHRPGTLIGKALEPLEKGTGEILVLLSLQ